MNQPPLPLPLLTWRDCTPNVPHGHDDWANTVRGWGYEENAEYASANYLTYPQRTDGNIHVSVYRITIDRTGDRHEVPFGHRWVKTVTEAKAYAETLIQQNPRNPTNDLP